MAMFSKQHYEALAEMLKRAKPPLEGFDNPQEAKGADDQFKSTVTQVCEMFERDNGNFKRGKFIDWVNFGGGCTGK